MKSIGAIGNRLGLYTVTLWRVGRWRKRYHFTCDACDLASARKRTSAEISDAARVHADLHDASLRAAMP